MVPTPGSMRRHVMSERRRHPRPLIVPESRWVVVHELEDDEEYGPFCTAVATSDQVETEDGPVLMARVWTAANGSESYVLDPEPVDNVVDLGVWRAWRGL